MVSSFSILGLSSASVFPTSCPSGAARLTPKVMSCPYFGVRPPGRLGSAKAFVGVRYLSVAIATTFGGDTGWSLQFMGNNLFTKVDLASDCRRLPLGQAPVSCGGPVRYPPLLLCCGEGLNGGRRRVCLDRLDALLHGRGGRIHLAAPHRFAVRGFEDEVGLLAVRRLSLEVGIDT